jgi:hypothetical protein
MFFNRAREPGVFGQGTVKLTGSVLVKYNY